MCDTDLLAHEAMAAGTSVHHNIIRAFGRQVMAADGQIDRRALARDVFDDVARRARLERIVHPAVMRQVKRWIREQARSGVRMVAVLVPLLYEAHLERDWDAVICVVAPPQRQRKWLVARGLGSRAVAARIAAQMPVAEKMVRAPYVVYNCGTSALLAEQVKRVIKSISGE